jgi:hypothetical protein
VKLARLLLALLLALPSTSWAGAGTTPLEFLSLDADARAVALGGAYSALAADGNAILYNPGALAFVPRSEAVFMHNQYFEGVSQEYAAFALKRGWGGLVNYLSYGDIPKTTVSNKTGAGLGSYGLSDLAVSGGYGRRVFEGLGVGGSLKYVRETIETVTADGMAFDAGALYEAPALPGLSLAGAVRNFGPPVRYQREAQNLPLEVRLGGAFTAHPRGQETTLALDVSKPRGNDVEVQVGLESVLLGRLPLRLGYDMRNEAGLGLAAGFGWRARDFRVDYAFVSFGDLGSAHRVSAAVRWGAVPSEPPPPPKAEAPPPPPPPPAAEAPRAPARHYLLPPAPVKAPPAPVEPAVEPAPPKAEALPPPPSQPAPRTTPTPAPKPAPGPAEEY